MLPTRDEGWRFVIEFLIFIAVLERAAV